MPKVKYADLQMNDIIVMLGLEEFPIKDTKSNNQTANEFDKFNHLKILACHKAL